jgi:pyruvate dehydrogenase complex dehydrogenase (E1) component
VDPQETGEWIDAVDGVIAREELPWARHPRSGRKGKP